MKRYIYIKRLVIKERGKYPFVENIRINVPALRYIHWEVTSLKSEDLIYTAKEALSQSHYL
jgi:hypothetical protein